MKTKNKQVTYLCVKDLICEDGSVNAVKGNIYNIGETQEWLVKAINDLENDNSRVFINDSGDLHFLNKKDFKEYFNRVKILTFK